MTNDPRLNIPVWLIRYAFAVAAVAAGGLLRQALTLWVGPGLPTYVTFYPSVMAAALLCGLGPGLVATLLAGLLSDYWLLAPAGFGIANPMDAVGLGLFSIMSLAISVVSELYRRGRSRLADLVARRTKELNDANASLMQLNNELEQRVSAKTADLRKANETLEQRIAERTSEVMAVNEALRDSRRAALNLMADAVEARKRAEQVSEDLRQERDFTTAVLDNTGALVVVLDREGRITRFNKACETITGYSSAEALGRAVWEFLVPPEDIPGVSKTWASLLAGEFPNQHSNRWLTRNGAKRLIAWSNTAIMHPDGHVEYVIGTGVDITERTLAEQDLLRTAKELARSNEDLEQFAHVASHDLKEPLRMVTGFMSLFKERYSARFDGKAWEYVGFATEAATRMQKMVDDLLAYSRAGREDTVSQADIAAVADSALTNLRASTEESGAVVTRDQLPTVRGHAASLTQVFQNMVGNAIKFRRPGTRPEIHIGAKRVNGGCAASLVVGPQSSGGRPPGGTGRSSMTGAKHTDDAPQEPMTDDPVTTGSFWLFSVRDNGIGIDQQFGDRIFMIFQRLHTREEYPGSGIGLAICKKIVERHGGRIWVESKPGSGSTFFFTLPA